MVAELYPPVGYRSRIGQNPSKMSCFIWILPFSLLSKPQIISRKEFHLLLQVYTRELSVYGQ
jgi:hypothetical protein